MTHPADIIMQNGDLTMFDFLQDLDKDIRDALLVQLRNLWLYEIFT